MREISGRIMEGTDPKYLQLYREYAKAIRAYENAIRDRRKVRETLKAKRSQTRQPRRPVGAPPVSRAPRPRVDNPRPTASPREPKIYLGDILGYAKVTYTQTPSPGTDPVAGFDFDKHTDQLSLKLYWNAKAHYERCKRAFFDYVRRRNIDLHKEEAKAETQHAANLQLLGLDTEEDLLIEAKKQVDAACRNAWAVYETSPSPKTREVIVLLLENFADAQLVGLESSTVKKMDAEVIRLHKIGRIGKE